MALCRCQPIRLLKCEQRGPVSAGDGGMGKARVKRRNGEKMNIPLGGRRDDGFKKLWGATLKSQTGASDPVKLQEVTEVLLHPMKI